MQKKQQRDVLIGNCDVFLCNILKSQKVEGEVGILFLAENISTFWRSKSMPRNIKVLSL